MMGDRTKRLWSTEWVALPCTNHILEIVPSPAFELPAPRSRSSGLIRRQVKRAAEEMKERLACVLDAPDITEWEDQDGQTDTDKREEQGLGILP